MAAHQNAYGSANAQQIEEEFHDADSDADEYHDPGELGRHETDPAGPQAAGHISVQVPSTSEQAPQAAGSAQATQPLHGTAGSTPPEQAAASLSTPAGCTASHSPATDMAAASGSPAGGPPEPGDPAARADDHQQDSSDLHEDAVAAPVELSEEEKEERTERAELCKLDGNSLFKEQDWTGAINKYAEGLELALEGTQQRAALFANRAAAFMELQHWQNAARDCTEALTIDSGYVKALDRRCRAYEALDDLDRALADAKKMQEVRPGDAAAARMVARLTPIVQQRQEKMKDEMMGKLKELGNTVLGKFGMSLDNFKAVQDPNSGSYSISFNQ